jgi:CRP-like cAMP-binding protein
MGSFPRLRAYLEARATFTARDWEILEPVFTETTIRAGEFLQRAGEAATHAAFVTKGCLRTYVIDAKGKEHIVQFAPEDWWVADAASLASGAPSQYFVDAIEDTDLLLLAPPSHAMLLERVPGYAASFQTGISRHAAAKDLRIVTTMTTSAEDRYTQFLETYPSVAARVPQWMVASYLGLTPETLSRVRRNRSRR